MTSSCVKHLFVDRSNPKKRIPRFENRGDDVSIQLPEEFEPEEYRRHNADLLSMDAFALRHHFYEFGRYEGRIANSIQNRVEFAELALLAGSVLEIGPFASPLLRGEKVEYADLLDTEALRARASELGYHADSVPQVHWVVGATDLSSIEKVFDAVLSSHVIEHQPDLLQHLRQVSNLLNPGGRYFLLVPDYRYCFDHYMAASTIADMIDARQSRRTTHSLKSLIEHRVLTTHNDAIRHWNDDHGDPRTNRAGRLASALDEWRLSRGTYVDVHSWYFTVDTFVDVLKDAEECGEVDFLIERAYAVRRNANEFWVVLRRR